MKVSGFDISCFKEGCADVSGQLSMKKIDLDFDKE